MQKNLRHKQRATCFADWFVQGKSSTSFEKWSRTSMPSLTLVSAVQKAMQNSSIGAEVWIFSRGAWAFGSPASERVLDRPWLPAASWTPCKTWCFKDLKRITLRAFSFSQCFNNLSTQLDSAASSCAFGLLCHWTWKRALLTVASCCCRLCNRLCRWDFFRQLQWGWTSTWEMGDTTSAMGVQDGTSTNNTWLVGRRLALSQSKLHWFHPTKTDKAPLPDDGLCWNGWRVRS